GSRTVGIRAGPDARRQLYPKRGAALRSLQPGGGRKRVEPAPRSSVLLASRGDGAARIVRPRVPDARIRKPAAGEFRRRGRTERQRASSAGPSVAWEFLRGRSGEGYPRQVAARGELLPPRGQ